jgi:hypothetical protein
MKDSIVKPTQHQVLGYFESSAQTGPYSRCIATAERKHLFVNAIAACAVSYDIPGPRSGLAKPILGGWSTDSIIYARNALPVNVVTRNDPFPGTVLLGNYSVERPNLNPGVPLYFDESNAPGGKIINAAFSIPATVQGDSGTQCPARIRRDTG